MSLLDGIRDQLAAKTPHFISGEALASIKRNIYSARQFIFDEAASRTVGRFVRNCPDLLAENLEFAIPPYDPCYIEIDIDALYGELRNRELDALMGATPDYRAGFLFVENRVHVLVNDRNDPTPFIAIFGTYFKQRGPMPSTALIEEMPDISDIEKQLLGTTYAKLTPVQRAAFRAHFGIFHCAAKLPAVADSLPSHLEGSRGEARTVAAALLILYNKRHVTVSDKPAERRLSRGKIRTYMAYSVVSISLTEPIEMRRAFASGDRGPVRRHEVRTHYAHRRIEHRCEHVWVRNDYTENDQWECSKCHGLRYLVRDHLRGSAEIGFVTKKYEVKE